MHNGHSFKSSIGGFNFHILFGLLVESVGGLWGHSIQVVNHNYGQRLQLLLYDDVWAGESHMFVIGNL